MAGSYASAIMENESANYGKSILIGDSFTKRSIGAVSLVQEK